MKKVFPHKMAMMKISASFWWRLLLHSPMWWTPLQTGTMVYAYIVLDLDSADYF